MSVPRLSEIEEMIAVLAEDGSRAVLVEDVSDTVYLYTPSGEWINYNRDHRFEITDMAEISIILYSQSRLSVMPSVNINGIQYNMVFGAGPNGNLPMNCHSPTTMTTAENNLGGVNFTYFYSTLNL